MSVPGKEIFRQHDHFGPVMVFEDGNKRYMAFDQRDQQSCQLITDPAYLEYDYTRAMLLALLLCPSPQRSLLLGLGGGSLACCLHHYWSTLHITAVELRPAVIALASSHFQLPQSSRLTVVEANARDYLRQQEHNNTTDDTPLYDIIFSDIYSTGGMDDLQCQEDYLDQCQALLNHNGWLVLNFWQDDYDDVILTLLKTWFTDVRICITQSGNWVIFACLDTPPLSNKQLSEQAKSLSKKLDFTLLPLLARLRRVL